MRLFSYIGKETQSRGRTSHAIRCQTLKALLLKWKSSHRGIQRLGGAHLVCMHNASKTAKCNGTGREINISTKAKNLAGLVETIPRHPNKSICGGGSSLWSFARSVRWRGVVFGRQKSR
jgi:hypothetical protein